MNLNDLTPPELHFQILSEVPDKMYNGLTILYEIQIPLFGKRRWLTEIKHIEQGTFFVDEQRAGPYKLWYHYHGVEACEGGVRFTDRVTYEVPFGIFGKLAHALFIRKTLERIFSHREQCFGQLLGPEAD